MLENFRAPHNKILNKTNTKPDLIVKYKMEFQM